MANPSNNEWKERAATNANDVDASDVDNVFPFDSTWGSISSNPNTNKNPTQHNKLARGKSWSNTSDDSGNKCNSPAPKKTPPPKEVAHDSHFGGIVGSSMFVSSSAA
eukprot:scaffold21051_cov58-Cyclotella_meneghiniana.AAC.4